MSFYLKNGKLCSDTTQLSQFTKTQIAFLTNAYKQGYDLQCLANHDLETSQMQALLAGLQEGIDISYFAKACYNEQVMYDIISAIKIYPSFTKYLESSYDPRQIAVLAKAARTGLDLKKFADPNIPADVLTTVAEGLKYKRKLKIESANSEKHKKVIYPSYSIKKIAAKYALKQNGSTIAIFNDRINAFLVLEILKKDLWGFSESVADSRFSLTDFANVQKTVSEFPDDLQLTEIAHCAVCGKPALFSDKYMHIPICSKECLHEAYNFNVS